MGKKKKLTIRLSLLDQMGRKALLQCAKIIGVETTRMIKGGIRCDLSNNELLSRIKQQLGQGTFPNRIERLAYFLEEWTPTKLDAPFGEIDPAKKVMELIKAVRNNFDRLSNLQKLEVLAAWIQSPQDCCCYEELDFIAEQLGFSYEEIDDEYILILPSPNVIATKIISMSDAEFYHSVVALAELSLPTEKYSSPPSISCAGYNFLKELAEYLGHVNNL
jgi:hypothetical protein